ncbi:MAG TPA: DUF4836 family protein [Puia sp.]|nr:DUF4836 family protein [Puia sp.]
MKNTLRLLLALLPVITFSRASAQTVNPLFRHIPSAADQVYHVDLKTLAPKLDWSGIASLMKEVGKGRKLPLDIMSMMNSGCDFHQDVIIARSNVYQPDSIKYTSILVHLTDSGKFVAWLRSQFHDDLHFPHQAGHERVAVDKHTAYAWNDKVAVISIGNVPKNSSAVAPSEHWLAGKAVAALRGSAGSYFTTDSRFNAVFSNDGDMQIWNRHAGNMGALTKMVQGAPGGANASLNGLAQLAAKTTSGHTFGTLRFEPGKISYHAVRLLSPKELSNLQQIGGRGLSNDLASVAPPGKLIGLAGLHYDIGSMIDSVTGKIPTDTLNAMLAKKGIQLPDIRHALKGDILFLAYAPDKGPGDSTAKKPDLCFMVSVDDPSAFARIAGSLKWKDVKTRAESSTVDTAHHGFLSWYAVQNGIAIVGSDPATIDNFLNRPSGSASPAEHLLLKESRTDIFYIGVDMHTTADFLTAILMKGDTISTKNQALLDALRAMDVLLVSSGGTKDGAMEADIQLRMTDKNKNGLASLLDIVGKLSAKPGGNAGQ